MERPTTAKQQRILEVIREFTSEQGYPPSVREIGERVGLSSSSTVQAHLKTLERHGLLRRDPTKPRALVARDPTGSVAVASAAVYARDQRARQETVALREALPWSFAGLIIGLAIFALLGRGSIEARLAGAIPGGFMIASCALVILLAIALVRRLHMPARILIPTTLVVFVLTLPRPHGDLIAEYSATLGASGLFLAIVVALACAGALELGRRRAPRYHGYLTGAIAIVAVAAISAAFGLSLATFLATAIEPLGTLGDSFGALLIIAILETALWIVGVHGPALLAAVVTV